MMQAQVRNATEERLLRIWRQERGTKARLLTFSEEAQIVRALVARHEDRTKPKAALVYCPVCRVNARGEHVEVSQ